MADELLDFASGVGGGAYPSDPGGLQDFGASTIPEGWANTPGPAVGAVPGAGGGGGGSWWGNIGTGLGKFASGLGLDTVGGGLKALTAGLGLGSQALGIGNQLSAQKQLGQQTKILQSSEKQAQAAAAPAVDFGTKTLNRAASGELTPALQAKIDEWTQKAKADAASRFASMGLGNSTQLDSFNRLIDEQAMSMRGSMLQQQEETGLAGLQTGVSAATGVMGASQAQQKSLEELIAQANASIGKLSGSAA